MPSLGRLHFPLHVLGAEWKAQGVDGKAWPGAREMAQLVAGAHFCHIMSSELSFL